MAGLPAARMTDMHTCAMCMGAPMPILPPCAPTVLIGKLPAARLTDLCACVAPIPVPVDAIIFGSPTVLICKLPAARVADPTAKGGLILPPGCPTVLIGLVGVAAPGVPGMPTLPGVSVFANASSREGKQEVELAKRQVDQQIDLLDLQFDQGKKAKEPPPAGAPDPAPAALPKTGPNPICVTLAHQAKEFAKAKADALLADAAYGDPAALLPDNIERASLQDLKDLGLHDGLNDMTKMPDSDFLCQVFTQIDPVTRVKNYILGFKGSTFPPWKSPEDWLTNLRQGMGEETAYYNRAMAIAKRAKTAAPGLVRYVGHSLGGGLAAAAAAAAEAEATTFNAAGLNKATLARKGMSAAKAAVNAYFVDGDILSAVQNALGLPEAIGRQIPLPPPAVSGLIDKATAAAVAALGALASGPAAAVLGGVAAAALVNAGRNHMMSTVKDALDGEAARVAAERIRNGCV